LTLELLSTVEHGLVTPPAGLIRHDPVIVRH
jgi:hypothetical protein